MVRSTALRIYFSRYSILNECFVRKYDRKNTTFKTHTDERVIAHWEPEGTEDELGAFSDTFTIGDNDVEQQSSSHGHEVFIEDDNMDGVRRCTELPVQPKNANFFSRVLRKFRRKRGD